MPRYSQKGIIYELVRRPVCNEDRYPDEMNPKRKADRPGQGYSMGKVLAQNMFSDAAAESGEWDAITCCPGDNVGPILSAHQQSIEPWQHNIKTMLEGKYQQNDAYRPWMTVDVRDTAEQHIRILEDSEVKNGERYIAWSTETRDVEDICMSIAELLPELGFEPPEVTDPFPERVQQREKSFAASGPDLTCAMIVLARSSGWSSCHSMCRFATALNPLSRSVASRSISRGSPIRAGYLVTMRERALA
ncbi:MAG: hypothetical protein U5O39_11335 [Gammaproteobacteria bacterium]|nr:hypothetical protein [Gammaproteobacteria bacterium]